MDLPDAPVTVIELRRYVMRPGRRDDLIALFDGVFVEPLEAAGMRVLGQFRDVDDPDLFVWMRGFADMDARRRSLETFYGGTLWAEHRNAANATMIDSDDVHLLRPAWDGAGLPEPIAVRAGVGADAQPAGVVIITIHTLHTAADATLLDAVRARLVDSGALAHGVYVTEPAKNDFPRLPVHEGRHVVVAVLVFDDAEAADAFDMEAVFEGRLAAGTTRHRLVPTGRSALHAQAFSPLPAGEGLKRGTTQPGSTPSTSCPPTSHHHRATPTASTGATSA